MAPPAVLMVGTGEYTTGYVYGSQSTSDKKIGVVALTMFDLRRRGKIGELSMVGVSGRKFPEIRAHLDKNIGKVYNNLDTSFRSFPADDKTDPDAYKEAIDALPKGSGVIIFTPDSTHYPIATYAIERGHHVMVTKPATQKVADHTALVRSSRKHGSVVFVEHHKRYDPAYADARYKVASGKLGDFNYFYSYMSQPKSQLETFKAWAGRDSDISYYLNSHHIDISHTLVPDWEPVQVTASGSKGIATELGCVDGTEDTITLMVDWKKGAKISTAVYTASWTAPMKAGVHSNQYFHFMGSKGEIRVNQAKRGYEVTEDDTGLTHYNPFYNQYAPDEQGNYGGQHGYGYLSFEKWIDAFEEFKSGNVTLDQLDAMPFPTIANTVLTTAILEAGRKSLDEKRTIALACKGDDWTLQ